MIKRTLVCVVLCGFMTAGSLLAHHSLAGVYDMKKDMELSGAVESVKFVNPHGSLTVAVKNPDGSMTPWVLTLGSATALAQRGIAQLAHQVDILGRMDELELGDGRGAGRHEVAVLDESRRRDELHRQLDADRLQRVLVGQVMLHKLIAVNERDRSRHGAQLT